MQAGVSLNYVVEKELNAANTFFSKSLMKTPERCVKSVQI